MKILLAIENKLNREAIAYALQRLFYRFEAEVNLTSYQQPLPEDFDLIVTYGKSRPPIANSRWLHIRESDFFSHVLPTSKNMPRPPFSLLEDVPLLFDTEPAPFTQLDEKRLETGDIVASAFFLISRYEEHVLPQRDQAGRFPASATVLGDPSLFRRPLVDEYSELIRRLLRRINVRLPTKKLWGDKDFAVCLTHDIDHLSGGWKELLAHEGRQLLRGAGSLKSASAHLLSWLRGRQDPYDNIENILQLESGFGASSTFFFIAAGKSKENADYHIDEKRARRAISSVLQNGGEVALHGSYFSLDDDEMLQQEKAVLETITSQPILGNRQHFLRFDVRDAWHRIDAAGFEYDSTLGFSEMAGYRAFTALPFHPFDFRRQQPFRLLEVPLIIMDTTLRLRHKLPAENIFDFTLYFLRQARLLGTCLTILWHNTYFTEGKHRGYKEAYQRILAWTKENNGLLCNAREMIEGCKGIGV